MANQTKELNSVDRLITGEDDNASYDAKGKAITGVETNLDDPKSVVNVNTLNPYIVETAIEINEYKDSESKLSLYNFKINQGDKINIESTFDKTIGSDTESGYYMSFSLRKNGVTVYKDVLKFYNSLLCSGMFVSNVEADQIVIWQSGPFTGTLLGTMTKEATITSHTKSIIFNNEYKESLMLGALDYVSESVVLVKNRLRTKIINVTGTLTLTHPIGCNPVVLFKYKKGGYVSYDQDITNTITINDEFDAFAISYKKGDNTDFSESEIKNYTLDVKIQTNLPLYSNETYNGIRSIINRLQRTSSEKLALESGGVEFDSGIMMENKNRARTKMIDVSSEIVTIKMLHVLPIVAVFYYKNGKFLKMTDEIFQFYSNDEYDQIRYTFSKVINNEVITDDELKQSLYTIIEYDNLENLVSKNERKIRELELSKKIIEPSRENTFDSFLLNPVHSQDGSEGSEFNLHTITVSEMYSAWSALVSNYPEQLTKTVLGKDESKLYDMLQIDFKYTNIYNSEPKRKVLIVANVHGDGDSGDAKTPSFAVYHLIKWTLENMATNEVALWIAMNYEFKIIPIGNPWGYDNHTRANSNNVDINRNYDADWSSGDSYAGTTRGTLAASESETRHIQNLINTNLDAYLHIDHHAHLEGSTLRQILTSKYRPETLKMGLNVNKFVDIVGKNVNLQTYGDMVPGAGNTYAGKSGINSATVESAPYDPVDSVNFGSNQLTNDQYVLIGMLRFS